MGNVVPYNILCVLRHAPAPATLASMCIRRTQTRSTSTGEAYFTHRLVRSERIANQRPSTHLAQSGKTLQCRPRRLAGTVPAHRRTPRRTTAIGPRVPASARSPCPTHHRPTPRPPPRSRRRRHRCAATRCAARRCGLPGTHPSALGRCRARHAVGDGPARAAYAVAGAEARTIAARRRHRLDRRPRGAPGLGARRPALAGRTQRPR